VYRQTPREFGNLAWRSYSVSDLDIRFIIDILFVGERCGGLLRAAYWAGLVVGFLLGLLYLFQAYYADSMELITNVLAPLMAGLAVVSSVLALRRYWDNLWSRLSRIWLCFTLGMVLWFLGETTWAIYVLILNVEIPYPSIADVFWLAGYIPLFIALDLYVRLFRPALFKKMYFISAAVVSVVSTALFAVLAPPIIAVEDNILTLSISLAYPALDLILLSEAILGLLIFTVTRLKGKIGGAWLLINAGIIMNVIGDMLFSYTTSQDTYFSGQPLDLFFNWGYILFALAFNTHMKEL